MSAITRIAKFVLTTSALAGGIALITDRHASNSHTPYGIYEKHVKRPLDAALATGALIALSPALLVTALLVRVKLGSPVLYTQDRPGLNGELFKLYKFRTMLPADGDVIDPSTDAARLTPFGEKLRSTSLDELPELINMIKG
ncbi:MAG: sugar transferase, partial [Atopobiaceae bacterium]|nr:sugar transferase [Atopobiaceae bacterium]